MKIPPSNPEKSSNIVDLSDILGQSTEKKTPGAEPGVNNQAAETQESTLESTSAPQAGGNGAEAPNPPNTDLFSPEPPPAPEPPPPVIKIDYVDQAKTMVMTLDMASQITLPIVYKRRMFTKEEREQLKDLKNYWKAWKEGKLKDDALDEDELKLIRIYDEFKEIVDAIDFSDKEINMLSNPLALMLQKYNMQSGPEAAFIFAIVTVMGPRIMPLFIRD